MNINLKKHNKHLMVLMLASILLTSAFVGIAFAFRSGISAGSADWIVFEGTAGSDYYDSRQYSYKINQWADEAPLDYGENNYPALNPANMWFNASKSLRLGMTEYGEFATPGGVNAGLAYGNDSTEWSKTESWAATAVNPALYIQGWVFYMNYTRAAINRAIEAYAIFSDTSTSESARKVYSWDGAFTPSSSGSGIVTAGSLTTSGVQVLYDSARLAVGRTSIVIRDGFYNEDVAKVTLTVVFNKVTKYAIIYKDVKMLMDPKVLDLIKDFSFGERYELDLARGNNVVNPSNQAFIHYYAANKTTVYQHPLTGDTEYDIVQAFNPNRNYTYFAAYWPNTTQYSVYDPLVPNVPGGFTRVLDNARRRADIPNPPDGPGEPNTPWVFAQWRYNYTMWPNLLNFLAKDANREMRFVEIAGMTDYNMGSTAYAPFRAQDVDAGDQVNNIDIEVQYLLNEIFNPEDLRNTVSTGTIQWIGLGNQSQPTDSAGAAMLADWPQTQNPEPLALFDRENQNGGTIPFGLDNEGTAFATYIETFSNSGKGAGTDTTSYMRTGLDGFVYDFYDGTTGRTPPQPIAGGLSKLPGYWYPSKDPLTERWSTTAGTSFSASAYDTVTAHPNGILTIGGPKANWLSRYFNDFNFALDREGTAAAAVVNGGAITGSAPTSNPSIITFDFFPVSTWKTGASTFNYGAGYAVISVARDINGTRGLSVYGWDGKDTYWASAWADKYLTSPDNAWIPNGCTAIILNIQYSASNREPTAFSIVKALGTITEFGYNRFADTLYYGFDTVSGPASWTGYITSTAVPPVTLPFNPSIQWYWEKLPTTSLAMVDFDP